MKKVFQTIIHKNHGNCMQAAVASLFDTKLEDVPNFIELPEDKWALEFIKFYKDRGYGCTWIYRNERGTELLKKIAKFDKGVNGYFYASVESQMYPDTTHAVIVDSDLSIVHDPNPNYKDYTLTAENVIHIVVGDVIVTKDGEILTYEQWEEANNTLNQ